ncbi:MAG: hypothetical protein AAB474_02325 [Patescibacteria group bacterium]
MKRMKRMFLAVIILFFSLVGSVFGGKLPEGISDYYSEILHLQFFLIGMERWSGIPWVGTAVFGEFEKTGFAEPIKEEMLKEKLVLILDFRREGKFKIIAIWHQKIQDKEIITVGCHADHDYLETLGLKEPKWVTYETDCQNNIDNHFLNVFEKIYQEKTEKGGEK